MSVGFKFNVSAKSFLRVGEQVISGSDRTILPFGECGSVVLVEGVGVRQRAPVRFLQILPILNRSRLPIISLARIFAVRVRTIAAAIGRIGSIRVPAKSLAKS